MACTSPPDRRADRPAIRRAGARLLRHAWAIAFALLLLYLLALPHAAARRGDFVHLWIGGRAALQPPRGEALYDPAAHLRLLAENGLSRDMHWAQRYERLGVFFYPPPAALFYGAFGRLPLDAAARANALLTLALVSLVAWLLHDLTGRRIPPWVPLALLLAHPAVFFNYALGQNGVATLALVALAGRSFARGGEGAGGAWLGLLVCKPQWLAALAWWPFARRRGARMAAGMAGGAALACGASLLAFGPGAWLAYARLAPRLARLHEGTAYMLGEQQSLLSLARRHGAADGWAWTAMAALLLATALLLARPAGRSAPPHRHLGMAWSAAALLNPHLFHYDTLLAAAALLLALGDWDSLSRRARALLLLLLLADRLAYPLTQALGWKAALPLPLFLSLLVWLWFARLLLRGDARPGGGA